MMTAMRENMPLIMWILVGAFLATIVFSWGMGGFDSGSSLDGVVGRVGGHEILYDQYNRFVQNQIAQQREKDTTATTITEAQIRQIRKDVWDEMIRNRIMDAYAKRWDLVTSDEEVAWAVRNSPPNWIRQNEAFLKDGRFDLAAYEEFLRDPRSADILIAIEQDYRATLSHQKVVDRVIAPVFVTADEAWEEYQATARKYNAAIVSFLPRNYEVDTTSVTESEIRAYYTEHRADYRQPERRQLAYISIPIVATIEDSNRVVELARELVIRSQSGEDFAELAGEFSEDGGSAQQGGDLGYFTSGRMVKEFDSTCFATEPGRTVGPIITRFGAHVIKVVDRKPGAEGDSVRASHILIKWDVGPDTEERISQKAKDFTDAAKTDGWERAAATLGLEVQETDPFPKNPSGSIPGLGPLQPLMDFTFASKTGNVSYVYRTRVRGQEAYAVFQLKKIIPEAISPVADVESQIRRTLLQDKRLELARQAAQAFRARVSDANSFLAVAQTESLKVDTSGEHAPRDYNRSWGSDEEIVKSLFALEPGQISQPLGNARGVYVALLINKTESNQQQFAAQKEEILTRLRQRKQNNLYTDWLAQAKVDIGVVDKRHLYYTDY